MSFKDSGKKLLGNVTLWINLIFLGCFIVQVFTGFIIPAEMQVFIQMMLNMVIRPVIGRDLFTGQIKAVYSGTDVKIEPKSIFTSKIFWTSIVGIVTLTVRQVTGISLPEDTELWVLQTFATVFAFVTHKPVKLV